VAKEQGRSKNIASTLKMPELEKTERWCKSGPALVLWIALGTVVVHLATGARYGFDRDELMALDDARHLTWGYVQYPPMTAFFARIALALFGASLTGLRLFPALAMALAIILTGSMARKLGGGRWAQATAAMATVPFCLGAGALMQYISFDYLCWVLVAWCVTNVAATASSTSKIANSRWWVAAGAAIGLGMLAKYTMGFLALGVAVGILATPLRKQLRSGWLCLGVLASLLIFFPNFLWQRHHHFVSLEFLRFLHARDVATGQTDWFLPGQLEITLLAFPLALAGLWFFFFTEQGRSYGILGWMYLVPLLLFFVMRGRDYYLAPAYPMLYAAGAFSIERVFAGDSPAVPFAVRHSPRATSVRRMIWAALVLGVLVAGAVALPLAPVNSRWWQMASRIDGVFREEIGWEEFVSAVAAVRDRLPAAEQSRVTILAGNYGEVGALNLYGEKFGLPQAISGVNSSWERGYGDPPDVVIVVGYPRALLDGSFTSCVVGGRVWNRYGVMNEETIEDPDIFVCRGLRGNWPEFWRKVRKFA
jgi:4-amino-4-deoxy-L-arabinose transferase-like glycosyltransferase